MINAARLSFQLGILSAVMSAFTFTARAQDNSLLTPNSDDGKTPVPLEKKAEASATLGKTWSNFITISKSTKGLT
jgi:hypothetical protein